MHYSQWGGMGWGLGQLWDRDSRKIGAPTVVGAHSLLNHKIYLLHDFSVLKPNPPYSQADPYIYTHTQSLSFLTHSISPNTIVHNSILYLFPVTKLAMEVIKQILPKLMLSQQYLLGTGLSENMSS